MSLGCALESLESFVTKDLINGPYCRCKLCEGAKMSREDECRGVFSHYQRFLGLPVYYFREEVNAHGEQF